jgi:hypothetical protein
MTTISERCSCGAKFRLVDVTLADGLRAVKNWRKSHECNAPDDADFVGSTTNLTTERDTIGFTRNNFGEEE